MGKFKKVSDGLVLNTESGVYYVRKTFRRLKIPDLFMTTGQETLGKAKSIAANLTAEHLKKWHAQDPSMVQRKSLTLAQVIDDVLKFEKPKKRPTTQDQYDRYLGILKKELGMYPVNKVTNEVFMSWLSEYRKTSTRKTFMDYQKYLNKTMNYAYRKRLVTHLTKIENPDTEHEARWRVFSPAEISTLWEHMNVDLRDQFALSYECMMRLREMLYLTWDRVDLESGIITLRAEDVKTGSKTKKGRRFQASPTAIARLRMRKERDTTGSKYVFPNPIDPSRPQQQNKTAWTNAKENAGIEGSARWHDLRHTALSRALLESKVQPVLVSQYAGVSMRTIERVYLHGDASKTAAVSEIVRISD